MYIYLLIFLLLIYTSFYYIFIDEISIYQVSINNFDFAKKTKLSGDLLRLVEKQTIQTAKKVYNSTFIANKSVSVVGLAFKELVNKTNLGDKHGNIPL